ncbi:unnamed protein product [Amaranthus hypochondriacus]
MWKFYVDDINRMIFPFKVGLAVFLVSLLVLIPATYQFFGGNNLIWAILTTAIMFEYTVGSTFSKGFNRALGSSFAGILAMAIAQLALFTGSSIGVPIILGVSIFIIGVITSFMKIWPSLVPHEYAFRVTLFTFCLIIASGYRIGHPIKVATDRLYSVAIGGIIAILVNVLVFPAWAGEELHKELVNSFFVLADSLQECVKKYIEIDGSDNKIFSRTVVDEFPDEPAYKKCRNSLISSNKFQTLANSAKWEPPHGKFNKLSYPWPQYVKIGTILRHCASEIMALHGILHSEIQAPYKLRVSCKKEITELTDEATKLLRLLGQDINNAKRSLQTSTTILNQLHILSGRLQWAVNQHLYLNIKPNFIEEVQPNTKPNGLVMDNMAQNGPLQSSYHKMIMKKQLKKLHSCPIIEVNHGLEDQIGVIESGYYEVDEKIAHNMKTLESSSALSLAAFTSLLVEFVAKLGHLVEIVDELSKMAKFNQYAINPI